MKKGALSVDLTCRSLPVHNTRLLGFYGEMHEDVRPMVLAVKRSAKNAGLAGASLGWLSSYAWTLMVIYYMQQRGLLPSLQALKLKWDSEEAAAPEAFVKDDKGRQVNIAFYTPNEARSKWAMEGSSSKVPLGDLFRGFFAFYGREYKWGDEVVSIRLGHRARFSDWKDGSVEDEFERMRSKKKEFDQIHIEDPIEVTRDLNFALNPSRTEQLRQSFVMAEEALKGIESFDEVCAAQAPPSQPTAKYRKRSKSRPKAKAKGKAKAKAKAAAMITTSS